ncbi:MAG: hypothetical protein E6J91_39055 [Deltaproteobacteria bacterium]|nr:MAG: hypothetical protein E6J91_39055 [Deltaproteobacteria bacterium]
MVDDRWTAWVVCAALAIAGACRPAAVVAPTPLPAAPRGAPVAHRTIAHDALDLEADVLPPSPGVERRLDALIGDAARKIRAAEPRLRALDPRERALETFRLIEDGLAADHVVYAGRGYVSTLHDALAPTLVDHVGLARLQDRFENRGRIPHITASPQEPYYMADCDTFSILYVAIGETLDLPIAMVDLPSPPGAVGHDYVVWTLPGGGKVAWEPMTGEERNAALDDDFFFHAPRSADESAAARAFGVAMTRAETLGYWHRIVAELWLDLGAPQQALAAFTAATRLGPQSPVAYNDVAWLLATSPDPAVRDPERAVQVAERSVALWPSANYLDTLAAAYAAAGRWQDAQRAQARAVSVAAAYDPKASGFRHRLALYEHCQAYIAARREERLAESWRETLQNPAWGDLAIAVSGREAAPIADACAAGAGVSRTTPPHPPHPPRR